MTTYPDIFLRNIHKTYGRGRAEYHALKGIDCVIEAGDFVAIMGPSGSGKSTLMNILGCLDTASSGEYSFKGVRVDWLNRNERALLRRYQLGFIFQGFHLLSRTTALENVELPLIYLRESTAKRHALAREALARVGLSGWENHVPSELSGGQQQRVAIARAMVTSPTVLLADEPTGNLDSATSEEIMNLILEFNREQGVTVLMVTHEPQMAAYAHRTIRVRDGLIAEEECA